MEWLIKTCFFKSLHFKGGLLGLQHVERPLAHVYTENECADLFFYMSDYRQLSAVATLVFLMPSVEWPRKKEYSHYGGYITIYCFFLLPHSMLHFGCIGLNQAHFRSPEHKVLKVSCCDRSVSVVHCIASTICFKWQLLLHHWVSLLKPW